MCPGQRHPTSSHGCAARTGRGVQSKDARRGVQCCGVGGPQGSTLPQHSLWHLLCTQMCSTQWAAPSRANPPTPAPTSLGTQCSAALRGAEAPRCTGLGLRQPRCSTLQHTEAQAAIAMLLTSRCTHRPGPAELRSLGMGQSEGHRVLSTCSMACALGCVCARVQVLVHGICKHI